MRSLIYCISVWFYRSLKNLIRKFRYEEADEASRLHGCMLYHSASRTMVEVCIDENFQQILCLVQTDHKPASQNIIIIIKLRTNKNITKLTIKKAPCGQIWHFVYDFFGIRYLRRPLKFVVHACSKNENFLMTSLGNVLKLYKRFISLSRDPTYYVIKNYY